MVLMPLSTIFQLYIDVVSFIAGGNRRTQRKGCIEYTSSERDSIKTTTVPIKKGTQDEENQSGNTTRYVLNTTIR